MFKPKLENKAMKVQAKLGSAKTASTKKAAPAKPAAAPSKGSKKGKC